MKEHVLQTTQCVWFGRGKAEDGLVYDTSFIAFCFVELFSVLNGYQYLISMVISLTLASLLNHFLPLTLHL